MISSHSGQPTFSAVSVIADTIVRTIERGVTITDAAVDGETTVAWCDLRALGPEPLPRLRDGRGRP